jgi:hypothetical protein
MPVDAEFVQDFSKRKDDLLKMLKITLQGDVKPSMRELSPPRSPVDENTGPTHS